MQAFFDNLLMQLESIKNEKIVLWGASLFLKEFFKENSLANYNIIGIIDRDPEKWGQKINGYEIISPKALINQGRVFVIITVKNNYSKTFTQIKNIINILKKRNNEIYLDTNSYETIQQDLKAKHLATNKIFLIDSKGIKHEVSYINGLTVNWLSENAEIVIGANPIPNFNDCEINCGENAKVFIGSSSYKINGLVVDIQGKNCQFRVGDDFSTISAKARLVESDTTINIGNDCMFSCNIEIRTCDSHSIYDIKTKNLINKPRSINIGNHVWIGMRSMVLKGSEIKDNSVIGANSLVSKKFKESNVVIVGNPAKIIHRNCNWDRYNTDCYTKNMELYEYL